MEEGQEKQSNGQEIKNLTVPIVKEFDATDIIGTATFYSSGLLPERPNFTFAIGGMITEKKGEEIIGFRLGQLSLQPDEEYLSYLLNNRGKDEPVESLARDLHEAGREAVEKGATVAAAHHGEKTRTFLGWDEITEEAREGRRIQARWLLERYHVVKK